ARPRAIRGRSERRPLPPAPRAPGATARAGSRPHPPEKFSDLTKISNMM
ncbi:hypothetical protein HMPREF9005_0383, partial [Actinomyces sp. oral taxon 178 str. F0338]